MSATRASWIYLFHGEDDLSSREAVQGLIARMRKDSPVWEYNIASFDGEKLSLDDLISTCQTVPFLADKRLAVVTNLVGHLSEGGRGSGAGQEDAKPERSSRGSKKAVLEGLLNFLPTVPESTRLVFLEDRFIPDKDPILRAIRELGGYVKTHRLEESGLMYWIRERAGKVGCKMSNEAMEELGAAVGPNARLLNSEILKLSTYCQDRTVKGEDVRTLVIDARKANVFAMVDAVGLRQPESALKELRGLLSDGDHPLRISSMLVRQFRLLIQVKELSEAGASPDEIARKAGMPFRGVSSLQRQARNFSFQQLERAYRQLLDFDLQVKTGVREPEAALELLIVDLLRTERVGNSK